MPSTRPTPITRRDRLERLSFALASVLCKEEIGEQYHPDYKRDRKLFRKIIQTQLKSSRQLMAYFRRIQENVWLKVDWSEYEQKRVKAAIVPSAAGDEWAQETIELEIILSDTLGDVYELGGLAGEAETGVTIGFSKFEPYAQKFLRQYTLTVAKDITATTADRIKQSLLKSLQLGYTQEKATQELASVIVDRRRAEKIAHTESIRAFSNGKLAYAFEAGATSKTWDDGQSGACAICKENNGKTIPLDQLFEGGVDSPPAHPWCRCLLKINFD